MEGGRLAGGGGSAATRWGGSAATAAAGHAKQVEHAGTGFGGASGASPPSTQNHAADAALEGGMLAGGPVEEPAVQEIGWSGGAATAAGGRGDAGLAATAIAESREARERAAAVTACNNNLNQ